MSTIVYVGAVGRSGTTLLERTIATSPTCTALGEVVHLWDRGVRDDESCGCGAPFHECEFWSEVGRRAFGGWDRVDLDQLGDDRWRVDRNRYIPWLLLPPAITPPSFRAARERLLATLDELYAAASEVAGEGGGDQILIDSSKHPSYLFLLRSMPSHDVRLLHVVRDPRGVAHSWSKDVARPESGEPMEQLSTGRAIGRWTSHNLLLQLASLAGVRRRRLSYGRFVEQPGSVGTAVDDLVGRATTEPLAIEGSSVSLVSDHTVSGNPSRFRIGTVDVRPDDAWQRSMPTRQRWIVGALTTPLRQVYRR